MAARGPLRVADLARLLGTSPSSAGRTCDRLERKGLVRRRRERADRRVVTVSLREPGRRALDEVTARRRAMVADLLSGVPAPERAVVAQAFHRVADAMGSAGAVGSVGGGSGEDEMRSGDTEAW